jgi:hypothetical protein
MNDFLDALVIILVVLVVIGLAAAVLAKAVVYIPLTQHRFAVVTRRYGTFRAPGSFADTIGRHTELLAPGGIHFRPRLVYSVTFSDLIFVPVDSVGIVHAKQGGAPLRRNQRIARPVPSRMFQDFVAFLGGGGQPGAQIEMLPSGGYYMLHPLFFEVQIVKRVDVPLLSVGLVVARVGAIMDHGHTLAKHVECDYFQDGTRFLEGGGEQGAQPALLPGGSNYAINPAMFDVITVDNVMNTSLGTHNLTAADLRLVSVDSEDVGVVIVTGGPAPDDGAHPAPPIPGHDHFQKPWVFLANGGRSGPQAEVLSGGAKYAINPLFARVIHIPTRELILSWREKSIQEDRYDSELQPIDITIEGLDLKVELTQTLAITARAAPKLVKRFGEDDEEDDTGNRKPAAVKRFVARVLGEVVKGYFTEVSSRYTIEDFIREQNQVRVELFDRVKNALKEQDVEARLTTISAIHHESDEINKKFREVATLRTETKRLEQEYLHQEVKDRIHEREMERKKKELGAAEQALIDMFGRGRRAKEREMEIRTKFPVPQVLVSGGENPRPLLMPALVRRDQLPDSRPPGWTIEMADDEQTAAPRADITETTRDDDTRKHDGDADDEETAAARAEITRTIRDDDSRNYNGHAER